MTTPRASERASATVRDEGQARVPPALLRRCIVVTAKQERCGVASMQWKFEIQFIKVSKGIEGVLEYGHGGGGAAAEAESKERTAEKPRGVAAWSQPPRRIAMRSEGFPQSGKLRTNMPQL